MTERGYFDIPAADLDTAHERLDEELARMTTVSIADDIDKYTQSFPLLGEGEGEFKAFVRRGESDTMVGVFPEFGGWKNTDFFARAMGVAAMIDAARGTDSTLVVLRHGNPWPSRSPLRLSREERKDYPGALAGRLKVIAEHKNSGRPSDQIVFGGSLGAGQQDDMELTQPLPMLRLL